MTAAKLKVGDVVVLNSGSPELTVTEVEVYPKSDVAVTWIDHERIQNMQLPEACFTKVTIYTESKEPNYVFEVDMCKLTSEESARRGIMRVKD